MLFKTMTVCTAVPPDVYGREELKSVANGSPDGALPFENSSKVVAVGFFTV